MAFCVLIVISILQMMGHRLGSLGSGLWNGVGSSGWLWGNAFWTSTWEREGQKQDREEGKDELNDFSYPHRELRNHSFVHWLGWQGLHSRPTWYVFQVGSCGQGMTLGEVAPRQSEGLILPAAGGNKSFLKGESEQHIHLPHGETEACPRSELTRNRAWIGVSR